MSFEESEVKDKFNLTIAALEEKIKHAAVLNASPALVEDIEVNYQGYKMKIKEVAAIRLAGTRSIIIEPWDKNILKEISAAIFAANIGAVPVCEQNYIRLNLPPITGEDKERIIKKIKEIKEQARVAIRHIREDFLRHQQNDKISEDQKFKDKERLEKIVKEYNEKIEKIVETKINNVKNA